MLVDDADLAWMRAAAADLLPERCQVVRRGDEIATDVPMRAGAERPQEYPFPALPNQPVTRYSLSLPAGADVQANDLLVLEDGQRIFAVIRTDAPLSYEVQRTAHCVLSATAGQLADAYLRPNATVASMRGRVQVYYERRVHLTFGQANPAAPLERLVGGVATLSVVLFSLPDDDFAQGDSVQIMGLDGPTVLPGIRQFILGGVLRRPLPFTILEADMISDVI